MQATSHSRLLCLVILATCLQAGAQDASPALAGKPASVQGVVINSITAEPVAHAHVILTPLSTMQNVYGAMTTVDGTFTMSMVPPDTYTVQVLRNGFLPLQASSSGKQIEIKPDENVTDLRLRLIPTSVISGRVLDNHGRPLQNATVHVIGIDSQAITTSNDLGEFRAGGLSAGRYLVRASPIMTISLPEIRTDGTAEVNYATTFYGGSLRAADATLVEVQPGQEARDVNIKLKRAPIVRVSGMIVGVPAGATFLNVQVGTARELNRAIIDQDGHFSIWRLGPGKHWLTATCYVAGKQFQSAPTPVDIAGTNIGGITLTLLQPFDVEGHVEADDLPPDKGNRTGGRSVLLAPLAPNLEGQEVPVDSNGDFKFRAVSAGPYRVSVGGFPDGMYVSDAEAGSLKMENGVLDLSNGAPGFPLSITLAGDGGTITGNVTGLGKAHWLSMVALLAPRTEGDNLLAFATISPDGSYAFQNVSPGKYELLAIEDFKSDNAAQDELLSLYHPFMKEVDVGPGESVTRDLRIVAANAAANQ